VRGRFGVAALLVLLIVPWSAPLWTYSTPSATPSEPSEAPPRAPEDRALHYHRFYANDEAPVQVDFLASLNATAVSVRDGGEVIYAPTWLTGLRFRAEEIAPILAPDHGVVWALMGAQQALASVAAAAHAQPNAHQVTASPALHPEIDRDRPLWAKPAPAAPGWLLQATWVVTLAAVTVLLVRLAVPSAAGFLLFTRLAPERLLEHPRREMILNCLQAEPGLSLDQLCQRTRIPRGPAQHHLRLLTRAGLLGRVRDGRMTRHFLPGGPRPDLLLLQPTRARLVAALQAEPELGASAIAARLGLRRQSAWQHLQRLAHAGLVEAVATGRGTRWRIAPPGAVARGQP
jgi:predicted transcriptional regulator